MAWMMVALRNSCVTLATVTRLKQHRDTVATLPSHKRHESACARPERADRGQAHRRIIFWTRAA
jgi:hypothetical protein